MASQSDLYVLRGHLAGLHLGFGTQVACSLNCTTVEVALNEGRPEVTTQKLSIYLCVAKGPVGVYDEG